MTVRTRFAPSPTGYLHIGGARTALFCWLHARQHHGRFVLRVEDTDRERSSEEAVQAILEGMSWLGLEYDEGPHYQSERDEHYRTVVDRLLREGKAYRCYCSKERLDALREEQLARKEKPRYDGRCRDLSDPPSDGVSPVVRFRSPQSGQVVVNDLIRGRIAFDNAELDDLVLARSDGSPTYNLTVVVDDAEMGITHVIRGDDHLNNTPRQINILDTMGVTPPSYAHVPMILGEDGKRLSKRHGAVSVLQYRQDGYLPQALLNYLVRLGWSYGDKEVFTTDEMIALFDIASVNKAASVFNPDKLAWLNQQHIKNVATDELAGHLKGQLQRLGIDPADGPTLEELVEPLRERSKTLVEMAEGARPFFEPVDDYEPKAARKHLSGEASGRLTHAQRRLRDVESWQPDKLHEAVLEIASELDVKLGSVAQPLRVALAGKAVSPPIDQTLYLLGRDRALSRIDRAIAWISGADHRA